MMSVSRQVLPDVLSVRESGLRSADAAQDAQLETSILLLPLVRHTLITHTLRRRDAASVC